MSGVCRAVMNIVHSIWLEGTEISFSTWVGPTVPTTHRDSDFVGVVRAGRWPLAGAFAYVDVRVYVAIDPGECLSGTSPCCAQESEHHGCWPPTTLQK